MSQSPPSGLSMESTEHRFEQVGQLRLHYVHLPGPGPVMILIHGIGMDWRVWQAISRRLRAHFDLYLVDLRGHGQSDKPQHGYTLGHYAADIEDFIDGLDLSGVVLVGSSLGGMVAAAVEAPVDIVSHRVLADPPLTGGEIRDASRFREILRLKHQPVPLLADYLAGSNPGTGSRLRTIMSEMWHEAADGVIEDMLADPAGYYDIRRAMVANESPTLLLQADPALGAVLSDAEAQRALELLPHGTIKRVPGAGHAIHATRPVDFTQLVRDFAGNPNTE